MPLIKCPLVHAWIGKDPSIQICLITIVAIVGVCGSMDLGLAYNEASGSKIDITLKICIKGHNKVEQNMNGRKPIACKKSGIST